MYFYPYYTFELQKLSLTKGIFLPFICEKKYYVKMKMSLMAVGS